MQSLHTNHDFVYIQQTRGRVRGYVCVCGYDSVGVPATVISLCLLNDVFSFYYSS